MAKSPARGLGAPRNPKTEAPVVRIKTVYGKSVVQRICRLIEGGATVSDISRTPEGPSYSTIYNWMDRYPEFRAALMAARERGAAALSDEVLDIARGVTAATATADKVKMNGVQWVAGKASPARWGLRADEPIRKGAMEMHIRVRRFEKLYDDAGRPFLREILPEGER